MSDSEENRPKRQRREKSYKSKAFERFRQLKSGSRNKYEVEEIDNLYETVDEKEYAKRVLDRQDDDWIVDDDGSGYVEDGRDIFDDDLDANSINKAISKGKGVKRKKALSDQASKGNLKYMLSNISNKKKEETQIQDDNMLSEILDEIDETPSCSYKKAKPVFVPRRQIAQDYFKKFTLNTGGVRKERSPMGTVIDEEETIETPLSENEPDTPIAENPESDSQPVIEDDFTEDLADEMMTQIEQIESQISEPETKNGVASEDFCKDFTESNGFSEIGEQAEEIDVPFVIGDDDTTFRFFWWDAFEDPEKQKGTVFLFGKTYCSQSKTYASCCVAIRNLSRQIFLLPRRFVLGEHEQKAVTYKDLYCEFSSLIAEPMQIKQYKAKLVQKKYAFDGSVPQESHYLEVRYPATDPKINLDLLQRTPKTFSRIFGINTSNLERFLLEAKIKGPCWLDIKNPEFNKNPLSWCKFEVNCASIRNVIRVDATVAPPPLVVSTISLRQHINAQTAQNEVLMVSCVTQTNYSVDKRQPQPAFNQHFCVITSPAKQPFPLTIHDSLKNYKGTRVQKMDSEKALLNYFAAQFSKIDPDVVVGHDLKGFQIDILATRLSKHDIASFSKFSRLRRTQKKKLDRELFTGRLVADVKISAKELIKSRTYDLPTLCQEVLKLPENQIIDLEPDEVVKMYENSQNIVKLITYTMQETAYVLKILYDLNIIPLALQITNIAGNVMSKTLMGGRSERNEFLLMHAFHEKDYILPDKHFNKGNPGDENRSRKKPTYSGGLVLEPKVGFYDKLLLLMDFNSLYPSIIQEFNICFTTMSVDQEDPSAIPEEAAVPGILPVEIKKLVDSRRQVKSLMAKPDLSSDLKMQYNIRQMALKLTANSMYGCLGFANSRFYAKNLAALVTQKGREILTDTKQLVERMSFEVVYGDTDSIMINTNMLDYDEVCSIGNKIKKEVNRLYKRVELDVDGIFKYLLLLKKKKYAAVVLTKAKDGKLKEEKEYKGLDIVRRDWSQLASQAGKYVLEHILSDQSEDERVNNIQTYLDKIQEDLKEGRVPIPALVITKQLTKDPFMYPNKESLPHVQVALRYNKEHGGHFRSGDTVSYVICDDGSGKSATQRAYHPEELKINESLKIDSKYYLAQQIHPVVARICDPIDGIDSYQIAEFLGLDGNAFKKPAPKALERIGQNITKPEVKFRQVDKFSFKCLHCQAENRVAELTNGDVPFLVRCTNEDCTAKPVIDYLYYVQNQLSLTINSYISKYYENKLICENPECPYETDRLPLNFVGKFPVCFSCRSCVMFRDYTEQQLFYQLSYFVYIFDCNRWAKKPLLEETVSQGYQVLRQTAEKYLNACAYATVNLTDLFEFVIGGKVPSTNHYSKLATTQDVSYSSDSE